MDEIKCPNCGEIIESESIEAAMVYAHDCGFDEGYETARDEYELGATKERHEERRIGCLLIFNKQKGTWCLFCCNRFT